MKRKIQQSSPGAENVSFKVTVQENRIIRDIARRTVAQAIKAGLHYDLMDAEMDVTAVHCNGCPLRLEALLEADDFNFTHDVFGILRHLDRTTGKLQNFFTPRFAQPERRASWPKKK